MMMCELMSCGLPVIDLLLTTGWKDSKRGQIDSYTEQKNIYLLMGKTIFVAQYCTIKAYIVHATSFAPTRHYEESRRAATRQQ
jgi:hypothetical protein